MSASAPMIEVEGCSKWFGELVAVSDVSFGVGPGVTALLGPNGAGKSTMLRMLAGLTKPSRGSVRILGEDPRTDLAVRARLGLVPQQESVFEHLSVFEFVQLGAVLQDMADPTASARAAIEVVELDPTDPRPVSTYSKGMRQRAKVAHALVHDPQVVMLDEPLTGLDPRQRLHMIALFHRLAEQGRCVLVSSHVLEEVERFGSRVLVIAQGRLAAEGDFHAIRELMDDRPLQVRLGTDDARRLGAALLAKPGVAGVHISSDDWLFVNTTDVVSLRRSVAGAAAELDVRLREFKVLDDSLESVFRYLVEGR